MAVPPPGWFQDPGGSGDWRWWDGSRWTEHLVAGSASARTTDWARSLHTAAAAEARLGGWVVAVVCLYFAVAVIAAVTTVVSLPALVHYVRLSLQNLGQSPPSQPAGIQAVSLLALPCEIVAAVVWMKWQYRAALTASILGYPARRSPRFGVWSWFIPIVNIWYPYQALRDMLPPGHPARATLLRAWLGYVATIAVAVAAYAIAFASIGLGVSVGCLAIVGYVLVGSGAYRFLKAVATDHTGAVARF